MRRLGLLTVLMFSGALSAVTFTASPGVAIPDNNAFGSSSTLNVPATNDSIYSLRVGVRITHTYCGDLSLWLLPPGVTWAGPYAEVNNGATVTPPPGAIELSTKNGGSANNYGSGSGGATIYANFKSSTDPITAATAAITSAGAPFTAQTRYYPEGLAAWNLMFGGNPSGDWTLIVADGWGTDTGTLDAWQLEYLPPPAGVLAIGRGANNAPGATLRTGATNQVAGQIEFVAGSNISLTSVTLQAENGPNLNTSFSRVALHLDANRNGFLDSGESAVFSGTVAGNTNITLTAAPAVAIGAGVSVRYLIVVDSLAAPAAPGVAFRIVANTNVSSTGTEFGSFPLSFGYHHFGPAHSYGSAPLIGVPIQDNYGPGVTDTITVPATADRIGSLRVGVRVDHNSAQHLDLYLIPPGVTWAGPYIVGSPPAGVITLAQDEGANGDDYGTGAANGPYVYTYFSSGTDPVVPGTTQITAGGVNAPFVAAAVYRPAGEAAWNTLYGTDPSGNWTLVAVDDQNGTAGTFISWYIEYRSRQRAVLTGTGAFGSSMVGQASPGSPHAFSVSNPGEMPLSVASIGVTGANTGDFLLAGLPAFPANVPAGGVLNFTVSFTPGASGARTANVVVNSNHNGNPGTLTSTILDGFGLAGVLQSATPIAYGSSNVAVPTAALAHTINNTGDAPLTITAAGFTGGNSGDWAFFPAPTLPIVIPVAGSAQIVARFTPLATGARQTTLRLVSNTGGVPLTSSNITVTGFGTTGQLATAASQGYGSTNVGTQTAQVAHTLNNTGDGALTISAMSFVGGSVGDWVFDPMPSFPIIIAPSGSTQVFARFAPTATGLRSTTLRLVHNSGGTVGNFDVALTGTGTAGNLSTLLNVAYGNTNVGVASAIVTHTITNTGTGSLSVSAAAFVGAQAGDWAFTSNPLPVVLAVSGSVQVQARFTPSVAGNRSTTLRFTSNSGGVTGAQTNVTVTGFGTVPVLATPNAHNYGSININQTTAPVTHTFQNTGDGPLSVTDLQFIGGDSARWSFVGTPSFPIVIAPNSSSFVQAVMSPLAVGPLSTTLRITSNSGGTSGDIFVALDGAGTVGTLLTAAAADYGVGFSGVPSSNSVFTHTIQNTGSGPLTITGAMFIGTDAAFFNFAPAPAFNVVIPAGLSAPINGTLTPSVPGPISATLRVFSDSGGVAGHFDVALSALCYAPASVTDVTAGNDDGGPVSVSAMVNSTMALPIDVVVTYTGGVGGAPLLVDAEAGTISGNTILGVAPNTLLRFRWDAYATERHTSDNYVLTLTPLLNSDQGQPGISAPISLQRLGGWAQHLTPTELVPPTMGPSAVFDATNDRMVIFGGRRGSAFNNEVWAYQRGAGGDAGWRRVYAGGTHPAPRMSAGAIYDQANNRMIIFGGSNHSGGRSDTWALSLTPGSETWTQLALSSPATPPARGLMVAVHDVAGQRMLVHGGLGSVVYGDTWALDLTIPGLESWGSGPIDNTGPARYGHTAALDTSAGRLVIYGGASASAVSDETWQLTLGGLSWSMLGTTGTPGRRLAPTYVHDTISNQLIVSGGWTGAVYTSSAYVMPLSGGSAHQWTQIGTDPLAQFTRVYGAAVIDAPRQQAVVFGGFDETQPLAALSFLDLSGPPAWSTASSPAPSSPDARRGATTVFDSANNRIVLFGGGTPSLLFDDAWYLDRSSPGATWQPLTVTGLGPSARAFHAALYDATNQRMIMMGGRNSAGTSLADLWTLDLSNPSTASWTLHAGTVPGRWLHAMALDTTLGRLLVHGGVLNDVFQDTVHAYDFTTSSWTQLMPAGVRPAGRCAHGAMFDAGLNRLVIFYGTYISGSYADVWALDLNTNTWADITPASGPAPSARAFFGHASNSAGTTAWLFSGVADFWEIALGEMWRLDVAGPVATWSQITLAGGPAPRNRHAGCLAGDDYVVTMGSVDPYPQVKMVGDTWEIDTTNTGAGFVEVSTGGAPDSMAWAATAYDPAGRMIAFGGENSGVMSGTTWSLGLSAPVAQWQRINATGPAPRAKATMVHDAAGNRMIMFGGRTGPSDATATNEVWALSLGGSPSWALLGTTGTIPPAVSGHVAVVDGSGRMIVFAGALTTGINTNAAYALNLATLDWTLLAASGVVAARRDAAAIYDPIGNRMIVYGGHQLEPLQLMDSLSLGATPTWTGLGRPGVAPDHRFGHSMVYDPTGHRAILFGGHNMLTTQNSVYAFNLVGDTWLAVPPQAARPQQRWGHSATWDVTGQRMVVAGGVTDGGMAMSGRDGFADAWFWGD